MMVRSRVYAAPARKPRLTGAGKLAISPSLLGLPMSLLRFMNGM